MYEMLIRFRFIGIVFVLLICFNICSATRESEGSGSMAGRRCSVGGGRSLTVNEMCGFINPESKLTAEQKRAILESIYRQIRHKNSIVVECVVDLLTKFLKNHRDISFLGEDLIYRIIENAAGYVSESLKRGERIEGLGRFIDIFLTLIFKNKGIGVRDEVKACRLLKILEVLLIKNIDERDEINPLLLYGVYLILDRAECSGDDLRAIESRLFDLVIQCMDIVDADDVKTMGVVMLCMKVIVGRRNLSDEQKQQLFLNSVRLIRMDRLANPIICKNVFFMLHQIFGREDDLKWLDAYFLKISPEDDIWIKRGIIKNILLDISSYVYRNYGDDGMNVYIKRCALEVMTRVLMKADGYVFMESEDINVLLRRLIEGFSSRDFLIKKYLIYITSSILCENTYFFSSETRHYLFLRYLMVLNKGGRLNRDSAFKNAQKVLKQFLLEGIIVGRVQRDMDGVLLDLILGFSRREIMQLLVSDSMDLRLVLRMGSELVRRCDYGGMSMRGINVFRRLFENSIFSEGGNRELLDLVFIGVILGLLDNLESTN